MRRELTEELAFAVGFDLIYRGDYFILEGVGSPSIKGKIVDGSACDVSICYDTSPNGLNRLPPEAAMAYAHRILSMAYFAKCVEGMPVIEPEKEDLPED